MELKEKLMQLAEKREIGEWYSETLNDTIFYEKLNTKDGTELGKILHTDKDIIPKIIIKSLCDADGKKLFKITDLEFINKMPIEFTSELFEQILIFNKMMPGAETKAAKN